MFIKIKTPFIFEKRRNTTPVAPIRHIHNILNSYFLTINTNTPQLLEKPTFAKHIYSTEWLTLVDIPEILSFQTVYDMTISLNLMMPKIENRKI